MDNQLTIQCFWGMGGGFHRILHMVVEKMNENLPEFNQIERTPRRSGTIAIFLAA